MAQGVVVGVAWDVGLSIVIPARSAHVRESGEVTWRQQQV